MKKPYLLLFTFLFIASFSFQAKEKTENENTETPVILGNDSVKSYLLNEISVISFKEQMPIDKLPASVSVLEGDLLNQQEVLSPSDLTALIPNLFMPKYGSKYSSAIFIRGIGTRMNESAVGVYVDNAPYLDKTAFDFDYYDLASIEVLRGPQGTLYGRNSMGGIINVNTISPLLHQGTKAFVSFSNGHTNRMNINHYQKVSENFGFSIGANSTQTNGFYTNIYNNENADELKSYGGRLRFDWRINDRWQMNYAVSYEYSDQNGFPYGQLKNDTVFDVNHNDPSSYRRSLLTNSLVFNYKGKGFDVNTTTSYQYFDDKMLLDQDFKPENIFTLKQEQNFHAITEEVIIKSNTQRNYQWLFGAFGFYQKLKTEVPVNFKDEGIQTIINPNLANIPGMPFPIEIQSDNILTEGTYKTPRYSGALFHQSTFSNLLTDGLSLTLGVRLDYEKVKLNYFSNTSEIEAVVQVPNRPTPYTLAADTVSGNESISFTEFLPKAALKYEFNNNAMIYGSVAKGYKAGGYNLQVFADIMQARIQPNGMPGSENDVKSPAESEIKGLIEYKPEYSWNYELGGRINLFDKKLQADAALFYIDCKDMQFVQSAGVMGRSMKNAGEVASYGAELSVSGVYNNFRASVNYGFTHATFRQYTDSIKGENGYEPVDYKGNYSPMAPKHTLSVAADYTFEFNNLFIDKLIIGAQYAGAGKVYWTVDNSASQDFYGLLNTKVSIIKGICQLDVWTKNTLDTDYQTFFYESMGNSFVQLGKPFQVGANFLVRF